MMDFLSNLLKDLGDISVKVIAPFREVGFVTDLLKEHGDIQVKIEPPEGGVGEDAAAGLGCLLIAILILLPIWLVGLLIKLVVNGIREARAGNWGKAILYWAIPVGQLCCITCCITVGAVNSVVSSAAQEYQEQQAQLAMGRDESQFRSNQNVVSIRKLPGIFNGEALGWSSLFEQVLAGKYEVTNNLEAVEIDIWAEGCNPNGISFVAPGTTQTVYCPEYQFNTEWLAWSRWEQVTPCFSVSSRRFNVPEFSICGDTQAIPRRTDRLANHVQVSTWVSTSSCREEPCPDWPHLHIRFDVDNEATPFLGVRFLIDGQEFDLSLLYEVERETWMQRDLLRSGGSYTIEEVWFTGFGGGRDVCIEISAPLFETDYVCGPLGGSSPVTLSPIQACTNRAALVADITIPPDTVVSDWETIDKMWRLQNEGTCTWTTLYTIVPVGGYQYGPATAPLPSSVSPGETVVVTVRWSSPGSDGTYSGFWMLRDGCGRLFGIGPNADEPLEARIVVNSD